MGTRTDENRRLSALGGEDPELEPAGLPQPPRGVSRVDSLPEEFVKLLQRRPLLLGDVLAERYRLVETLGDGAMGTVFVAENLSIGRKVAVKVLKPELLTNADFRRRFQQEAEATAAIEHRNVARFLDLVVGDPTFLVMEYVRGPTLARRLKEERRFAPLRAASIARQLCWGLEAAHRAGVVHRDIKPANVILSDDPEVGGEPDDQGEMPKLIDFGLAKLATTTAAAGLTRTGQIVGTPEYMSPEQIANKEVDARSDVYALGCLLYEMVAGRPPFVAQDDLQMLYQQMQAQPEPLEKHAPAAPRELCRVVERALQKDPERRYPSMRAMAEALARVRPPTEIRDERTGRVVIVPTSRAPWIAFAAALGVLGAAGGFALGRRPRTVAAPVNASALIVTTKPAGAKVEVDGRAIAEATPTMVRGLAPGPHTVRLAKDKLAPVERQVTLGANERALVSVVLPPSSHRVEVRSVPEGAAVYLDGRLAVGETPTTVEVTDEDFHELRVEKIGYEPATKAITPDDRDPFVSLSLAPERLPRGALLVDANAAAEVWLDGIDTGYTTPTLGMYVPVGEHVVAVRAGDAQATARVKVAQGQTVRLLLSPTTQEPSPAAPPTGAAAKRGEP